MADRMLHEFTFEVDVSDSNGQPTSIVGNASCITIANGEATFAYPDLETAYITETIVESSDVGDGNFQIIVEDCRAASSEMKYYPIIRIEKNITEPEEFTMYFTVSLDTTGRRVVAYSQDYEGTTFGYYAKLPDGFDVTVNHTYTISKYEGKMYVQIDGVFAEPESFSDLDAATFTSFVGGTLKIGRTFGQYEVPTINVGNILITTLESFSPPVVPPSTIFIGYSAESGWTTIPVPYMLAGDLTSIAGFSKVGTAILFTIAAGGIPQGSTIQSAALSLTGFELGAPAAGGVSAKICGAINPASIIPVDVSAYQTIRGTDCGGASNANRTIAEVTWNEVTMVQDTVYSSPDISSVLTEIATYGEITGLLLFFDDHDGLSSTNEYLNSMTSNVVLTYALATSATVTYNGNGNTSGTVPVDSTVYNRLDIVTVLGNIDLTKTGYVYSSWNTSADGTGTDYEAGDTFQITGNTTLYAKWLRNYKANQIVKRGYLNYICIQDHIATADTEPEVGINWESYWRNLTEFFRHNDLLEAQGGTTGQYYHLTSAQNTRVGELEETDSPAFYGVRITSSRGGGLMRTSSIASVNFATDSTAVININIPATSRILGVQLIIDENLTSGYGASSWSASFIGGSTQQICTGVPLTKDLTVDSLVFAIVTTETDIEITANYGSFDTGVITAVCYYETFEDLTPDPV